MIYILLIPIYCFEFVNYVYGGGIQVDCELTALCSSKGLGGWPVGYSFSFLFFSGGWFSLLLRVIAKVY